VLADARPPALLACAPDALVLADARPPALLACAPDALVLADARPPALLACAPDALLAPPHSLQSLLVLADARAPALPALAPLSLVLADALSCRTLAHFFWIFLNLSRRGGLPLPCVTMHAQHDGHQHMMRFRGVACF